MAFRVTYATLAAESDEVHRAFDAGLAELEPLLGATHGSIIGGEERSTGAEIAERSPVDTDVLVARFVEATAAEVAEAVGAAKAFAPTWAATPWPERVRLLDAGADLISDRRNLISAVLTTEVGKNRLESLGDVEETADLIRYYTNQLGEHGGFEQPMGRLNPAEATYDVMRPYGTWAVVTPFNFPAALSGGPAGAALAAGNTVVVKPPPQGAWTTLLIMRCLLDAGLPPDALHVVVGGDEVGQALVADPRIDGITFTGSYEVGMQLHRAAAGPYPRPVICEMGGKNPVIVSRQADLDLAAEGTARSAFGLSGQKCSAASRVYVERPVADAFIERLVERARAMRPADPRRPRHLPGPGRRLGRRRSVRASRRRGRGQRGGAGRGPPGDRRAAAAWLLHGAGRGAGAPHELGGFDGAVRTPDRRRARGLARRSLRPGQRHPARADRRLLLPRPGRDR